MTEETTNAPGVNLLEWDTAFFGFPIGRVLSAQPSPEEMRSACKWARNHALRCLYWLAENSATNLDLAAEHRFKFVDLRCEYSLDLTAPPPPLDEKEAFRDATPADLPFLREIARLTQRETRFTRDAGFPSDQALELYARWIERDLAQHHVLTAVAPDTDRPCGFISYTDADAEGTSHIGLLSVLPEASGRGLGRSLVVSAIHRASNAGARSIHVVTQGGNVAAQRVYQHAGFRTARTELWYHRWF